jgi:hypothetical protein
MKRTPELPLAHGRAAPKTAATSPDLPLQRPTALCATHMTCTRPQSSPRQKVLDRKAPSTHDPQLPSGLTHERRANGLGDSSAIKGAQVANPGIQTVSWTPREQLCAHARRGSVTAPKGYLGNVG